MKFKKRFIFVLILICFNCMFSRDIEIEELKDRVILVLQRKKEELEALKRKLKNLERDAEGVAKNEELFREIMRDLDLLFPSDENEVWGCGEIWERLDRLIKRVKDLKEEERFRNKKSYVISKSFVVSLVTAIAVCLGFKYYDSYLAG